MLASEACHAADVIVVLVRDDDRGQMFGRNAEAASRRVTSDKPNPQSSRMRVVRTSTISALPWLPLPSEANLMHVPKFFRSAAGDHGTHRCSRYLRSSCSTVRMRVAASDFSGVPSALSTLTSVPGFASATTMR